MVHVAVGISPGPWRLGPNGNVYDANGDWVADVNNEVDETTFQEGNGAAIANLPRAIKDLKEALWYLQQCADEQDPKYPDDSPLLVEQIEATLKAMKVL